MDNFYNQTEFDKIWARVSAANDFEAVEPQSLTVQNPTDPVEQLRHFMDREASDARFYREMAKACRNGPAKRLFLDLAQDERDHLRKLQIEYFLLTGDTYVPNAHMPAIPSLLAALRQAYLDEEESARAYDAAARTEPNSQLAALYAELAESERRHRARVRDQITRILG